MEHKPPSKLFFLLLLVALQTQMMLALHGVEQDVDCDIVPGVTSCIQNSSCWTGSQGLAAYVGCIEMKRYPCRLLWIEPSYHQKSDGHIHSVFGHSYVCLQCVYIFLSSNPADFKLTIIATSTQWLVHMFCPNWELHAVSEPDNMVVWFQNWLSGSRTSCPVQELDNGISVWVRV